MINTTDVHNPRKPSRKLTAAEVSEIKRRIAQQEFQNRIAADYDVNPGRISEIKNGKSWSSVLPER